MCAGFTAVDVLGLGALGHAFAVGVILGLRVRRLHCTLQLRSCRQSGTAVRGLTVFSIVQGIGSL